MKTWKKRIPALLLALVMCLSLLPTTALANEGDFTTIENGELTKYNGPGGDVAIPDGVTSLGGEVFSGSGLTSVTVPGSVSSVGDRVFWMCESLTEATIEEGVPRISESMFYGCSNLRSVTIPASVSIIRYGAFVRCPRPDIYYGGSQSQWNTMKKESGYTNTRLTVHYAGGAADPGTTDPGTTDPGTTDPGATSPGVQSGALTIRRGPDSDSVDLSGMDYPTRFYW